jgi:iron complex transport system substrate-binding protein
VIMKSKIWTLSILLFAWQAKADIRVEDYSGEEVVLSSSARRIVSLAPHITENLFSVNAGQFIAATVEYSDYPEAAKTINRIGGFSSISIEKIIEVNPDLVIAWGSGNKQSLQTHLQQIGIPVYVDEPRKLDDIARSLVDFAVLTGQEEIGKAVARDYLDFLQAQKSINHKTTVFYQIWNSPLQTVNGEHLITNVIELCGGHNIYSTESTLAPNVGIESVLEKDPQFIIASGVSQEAPPWLADWKQYPNLTAVKKGNLHHIPPDYLQRQTLRIQTGVTMMCEILAKDNVQ